MAGKIEKRFIELNLAEDGEGFTGTLLNFGDVADKGSYREKVVADGIRMRPRMIMNRQHDRSKPIARVGSEHLQIERNANQISVKLNSWPNSSGAQDAKLDLNAGLLDGLSMELSVESAEWDGDLRTINRGEIVGFAMVDQGAYPSSVINRAWDGYEDKPADIIDPRIWL